MQSAHEAEPTLPADFVGYMKCVGCGTQILSSFGFQTGYRCIQCWKDRHPLATLEVMNASARFTLRAATGTTRRHVDKGPKRQNWIARNNAQKRMANIFPDVYAMILDEERAKRGLSPIAHYDPLDFNETASKTLAFEDVYDALESSGATDA